MNNKEVIKPIARFYCTLHASTKQCKWFMNDKNACKECAYKTKV